jgi:peptide/nickel transport system permease protein
MTTGTPASAVIGADEIVPAADAVAGRPGVLRTVLRRPAGAVAAGFLVVLVVIAVGAPVLAPHDPELQDLSQRFAGPSAEHWLGADEFGRDVLSRIMHAARISLAAPLISLLVAGALGIPSGLLAGLRRGAVDAVAGRLSDTLLAIPAIVLALAIVAVLGPSLTNAMIAIGIVFAPQLFRVIRGAAFVVAEETYIASATAIGCGTTRLVWRHVLPNIRAPLLVQVTLLMGFALLVEASLSFLGLGVQPPQASWGSMLKSAYDNQFDAPYSVLAPGISLMLTTLAFNTLGDTIRDAMAGGRSR